MPRYRITPKAHEDLREIGRYTQKRWGKIQRNAYLLKLEKRFNWLAEHPKRGKHRPEIGEGFYSFPEGRHIIFYLINVDFIDIIGIPHRRMDIIDFFDFSE